MCLVPVPAKNILITGASGFAGSRIAAFARNNGCIVNELGRRRSENLRTSETFQEFTLGEAISPECLRGNEVLIHCAYDFTPTEIDEIERINVRGSRILLDAAHDAGVERIIVISSVAAAHGGAVSNYRRAKRAIEMHAEKLGAVIVRPALIFGREAGGMVGTLSKLSRLPIIPTVGFGRQSFYLCHDQDLAALVYQLATSEERFDKPIVAANEVSKSFKQIVRTLAAIRGKRPLFFPFPFLLLYVCLRFVELIGLRIGMRSDSLKGLANRDLRIDFSETRRCGVEFREFSKDSAVE